jgi:hypothetical protein
MPASSKRIANAAGFSGHDRNSPALWINNISAPFSSIGIFIRFPYFSGISSSSMNLIRILK